MKKLMTLAVVVALSAVNVVEAKRGGGMRVAKSKPTASQQQQKTQPDADFNNTPNMNATQGTAQAQNSNRMGNFVTGAAAGYLLSNALSPTEAQAKETVAEPMQAVGSEQNSANSANPMAQLNQQVQQMPAVPTFKAIDANDPNLIERTANYSRYCLNGVQYLSSGSQLTLMVDRNNAPVACAIQP